MHRTNAVALSFIHVIAGQGPLLTVDVLCRAKQADWVRSICDKHGWKMKWMDVAQSQAHLHAVSVQIELLHAAVNGPCKFNAVRSMSRVDVPCDNVAKEMRTHLAERSSGIEITSAEWLLGCCCLLNMLRLSKSHGAKAS